MRECQVMNEQMTDGEAEDRQKSAEPAQVPLLGFDFPHLAAQPLGVWAKSCFIAS
jgi:hypothetical protein